MNNTSFIADKYEFERDILPNNHNHDQYYTFFSKQNVEYISVQITLRLEGVRKDKKHIIVPTDTIISVMDSFYKNTYRDVDKLTMMVISYISDYIRTEYEMEQQNNNLSAWVQQYTPDTTLQQVPKIKLREKRPTPMEFHMHY